MISVAGHSIYFATATFAHYERMRKLGVESTFRQQMVDNPWFGYESCRHPFALGGEVFMYVAVRKLFVFKFGICAIRNEGA